MESEKIRKYVLDSSIAVKWFVDEEGSDRARLLKDRFIAGTVEITAPYLLKYEVANALRQHPIAQVDQGTLLGALTVIEEYQFLVNPPKTAWTKAIELSYSSKVSPYDGIYLGLAHALNSKLITADEELIEAVPAPDQAKIISLAKFELH